jgi:hypothetical protein
MDVFDVMARAAHAAMTRPGLPVRATSFMKVVAMPVSCEGMTQGI